MPRARRLVAALSALTALVLAACSAERGTPDPGASTAPGEGPGFAVSAPEGLTVLTAPSPEALALRTSQALFTTATAPVVVGGAPAARRRAADLAAELGAPVLPVPAAQVAPDEGASAAATTGGQDEQPPADGPAAAELDRLGARAVVAVGTDAAAWAAGQQGIEVVDATSADGGAPAVVDAVESALGADYASLRAEPVTAIALVAEPAEETALAVATAQAAGAQVARAPGGDPRALPRTVAVLAENPDAPVLALGSAFTQERLAPLLEVARTGTELPGDGQVLFPYRRMVALYGHPGVASLGVLGEQDLPATLARAEEVAAQYAPLADVPVVPTLEVIATVATAEAGPDGDYSRESDPATLRPWVDAAGNAGAYVLLDLQPGRTDFLTQARRYEDLLREPHVGLALDPEWRLGPGERHLQQIGSVEAEEVEAVADWLAALTRQARLPQKALVLHQFRLSMLPGRDGLRLDRDELAVVVHADGNGVPAEKLATWDALGRTAPDELWWGWKNFYDEDNPTFTPAETYALVPEPVLVSYQ